jgi:hypothetical protein
MRNGVKSAGSRRTPTVGAGNRSCPLGDFPSQFARAPADRSHWASGPLPSPRRCRRLVTGAGRGDRPSLGVASSRRDKGWSRSGHMGQTRLLGRRNLDCDCSGSGASLSETRLRSWTIGRSSALRPPLPATMCGLSERRGETVSHGGNTGSNPREDTNNCKYFKRSNGSRCPGCFPIVPPQAGDDAGKRNLSVPIRLPHLLTCNFGCKA